MYQKKKTHRGEITGRVKGILWLLQGMDQHRSFSKVKGFLRIFELHNQESKIKISLPSYS